MKRFTLLILFSFPLILFSQLDISSKGIKWVSGLSWSEILEKARLEKKYILVDCYATWCGPCKEMDEKVYNKRSVGDIINPYFISVKVQGDETGEDNEDLRKFKEDAAYILKRYEVKGFPTYLFFTPDGKLIHRGTGYKEPIEFTRMASMARDPQKPLFYSLYHKFRSGKRIKDPSKLAALAGFTLQYINKDTAYQLARSYYNNYLQQVDDTLSYTRDELQFIVQFEELVQSGDRFFSLAYHDPERFDSICGYNTGKAAGIVKATITREELYSKLFRDNIAFVHRPDWVALENAISEKYPQINAKSLVINYRIDYYEYYYQDWRLWANAKNEKLELYPPTAERYASNWQLGLDLNQNGAWKAFSECSDTTVLMQALRWIDIAIDLNPYYPFYLDTKANLLHKLGRTKEAIFLEEVALAISSFPRYKFRIPYNMEVLSKMKQGVPTWPEVK